MRNLGWRLWIVVVASLISAAQARAAADQTPGCESHTPRACLELAMKAMGGRERLEQLKNVRMEITGHTLLMEQSYRQAPFITSYETATITLDLADQRYMKETSTTWPEADAGQSEFKTTVVVGPQGGVARSTNGDRPCGPACVESAREALALGPARLLLTAAGAADLHYAKAEALRSTQHTVLGFTWNKAPVRVLINRFNHLPDAVETTQVFHDFWYFWGDVRQRIDFDNWKLSDGIRFPTNFVEERNGALWRSTQALKLEFNVPLDAKAFQMDAAAAHMSVTSPGWERPFSAKNDISLGPGVDLFPGAWNATIVKLDDGIVILEAPISETYIRGVIAEAEERYPGAKVKAVLSTSDSWPHTGGVRFAVASGAPVYILDLNRPLLERMVAAPHTLAPDSLAKSRRRPIWKIVSGKMQVGIGRNRMELIPIRGASTERQYMVYFPEYRLLYASDTLVINDDGSLYDPELMFEVKQAVEREGLMVDTVYAMHQTPVAWARVAGLIEKAAR